MTTLIFPSCNSEAVSFYYQAKARGDSIVASSSFAYDETAAIYDKYFRLPNIFEKNFLQELKEKITTYSIQNIYCAHQTIHCFLTKAVNEGNLTIPIISTDPLNSSEKLYRDNLNKAKDILSSVTLLSGSATTLSYIQTSAIVHNYSHIFGCMNESKLIALISIFITAPKGDIVEIGTLYGKSAFVFKTLADHHKTGNLLLIDPWANDEIKQETSLAEKMGVVPQFDMDLAFKGFCMNLIPFGQKKINYLRMPSVKANEFYLKNTKVKTAEFGTTNYKGKIAILHIDGNHEYDAVLQDANIWIPYVLPGGWIIVDDYYWLEGEGPRKVGDKILEERKSEIHTAFVCGKALFIKLQN